MDVIAGGLSYNHTILGLHVKGNEAQVDSCGFIKKLGDQQTLAHLHYDTRLGRAGTTKRKTAN